MLLQDLQLWVVEVAAEEPCVRTKASAACGWNPGVPKTPLKRACFALGLSQTDAYTPTPFVQGKACQGP